jgi:hypothetical protein
MHGLSGAIKKAIKKAATRPRYGFVAALRTDEYL